jgi:hypothetical protein
MKRTRIKPVSSKRQAENVIRKRLRKRLLEERPWCEARIQGCTRIGVDLHEIKTRARGGSITDEDNILILCRHCHAFITVEPAWSQTNGFTVHAWATEADMKAAARARAYFASGL